jgi:hypothetical protein
MERHQRVDHEDVDPVPVMKSVIRVTTASSIVGTFLTMVAMRMGRSRTDSTNSRPLRSALETW